MSDPSMSCVTVRRAVEADAEAIVDLHFASVRHYGNPVYPPEIIDAWSPHPDERRWERMRRAIASEAETFLVAETGTGICGFGVLCAAEAELRALYVDPAFGRRGVGSLLLAQVEALAAAKGVRELHLDGSLNAQAFYRERGFQVVERGLHRLSSGVDMQCVRMWKSLCGRKRGTLLLNKQECPSFLHLSRRSPSASLNGLICSRTPADVRRGGRGRVRSFSPLPAERQE